MTILDQLKTQLDFNGYAWKNDNNFINHLDAVCYIPENAEDISEAFTRNDLQRICRQFIIDNEWNIEKEKLVGIMYPTLQWESPYTWLTEFEPNDHEL